MDVNKNIFLTPDIITGKVNTTLNEINRFNISTKDILITRTSETKQEIAFASCLLSPIKNCVYSGFLLKASPLTSLTYAPYITLLLHSSKYRNILMKISTETSRALINSENLSKIELRIPTMNEQARIALFFQIIENKIKIIEQKIDILKKYKEGLCDYLFKESIHDSIHLYDLVTNNPSQMLTKDIEQNVGIYPVYDATGKILKFINYYHQTSDTISIIKYGSGCGRTFISKGYHSILGTMTDLKPFDQADVLFIYAYTLSRHFASIIKKYTEIGTTPNLYFSDYSKATISNKAIKNKKTISLIIGFIEKKELLLFNEFNKLKNMKKYLLDSLFI